jgi:hypothetical protein
MSHYSALQQLVGEKGFAVINNVFTDAETESLILQIESTDHSGPAFRKTKDLFAIRNFLGELPDIRDLVFNTRLKALIHAVFGEGYFVIKSIYFDKPQQSNWFVAYHQDLMIAVNQKTELPGFGPWTIKPGQVSVLPPVAILAGNFTLRIHLDATDEHNGALKVVPGSHLKNIYRPETINWTVEKEEICAVEKGGVMMMKPLLLHASGRSTNNHKRRVIHIEFSKAFLPEPLQWSEHQCIPGL